MCTCAVLECLHCSVLTGVKQASCRDGRAILPVQHNPSRRRSAQAASAILECGGHYEFERRKIHPLITKHQAVLGSPYSYYALCILPNSASTPISIAIHCESLDNSPQCLQDIPHSTASSRSTSPKTIAEPYCMVAMPDKQASPQHPDLPHPSEALEFVTSVVPQPRAQHIEYARDGSSEVKVEPQAAHITRLNTLIENANNDVEEERRMTIRDALRLYPKAIGWSVLLSLTIVMEGYDLTIINGFYVFPEFKKAYGERDGNDDYQITTAWQSGLTNGAVVGEIVGLLLNGHLTERFGYRRTLVIALFALILFIFLAVFAFNIGMLMASEVLCGLSWGVFQTLSTTYAAEIMPVALRAYLTSNVNLCWLIGQIIGNGVLRGLVNLQSRWSFRVPFCLQCSSFKLNAEVKD